MFDVKIKKACVYTRVSTDEQAEKLVSLSEQERMGKAAIVSKGWEYVKTFCDDGFSGKSLDRPALQEMIKSIKSKEIEAVVIFKLDRLSRRQADTMVLIEDVLLSNDVELISLSETLDTTTPWGRAMIGILASFNQLERENIVQRTSLGRNARAREGKYAGGKPPIGYKALNGELVVVPEEAEIVRLVFKMRSEGKTLIGIAEELNKQGYRTKKGYEFKHSAIQNILANESTYRGNYKYGKEAEVKHTHEPILNPEE